MGKIIDVLARQHEKQMLYHWYESYWMIDIHGVICHPNYDLDKLELNFVNKFACTCLQMLTLRDDTRLILYTSSYPDQILEYLKILEGHHIKFDYINENPEVRSYEDFGYYENKPYFDIYLDDKAGFHPNEWLDIIQFLSCNSAPNPEWKNPNRKRLTPAEISARRRRVKSNVSEQIIEGK
ncbi:MAG: hypothetical protein HOG49_33535 [Candidatus Scalindua sp.]|jgi:hypothetical protein|nr:hypothetical protein [Candidatus Scalindua sp.]